MDVDPSRDFAEHDRALVKTAFHLRLESYVTKLKSSGCWYLKDSKKKFLTVPGRHDSASIHRLLYAAFVGPIPENVSLVPVACGSNGCINPWHQEKKQANFYAKELDLEEVRLGQYEPRYSSARTKNRPQVLPKGLTVFAIKEVRALYRFQRASDQDIAVQTQVPRSEVRKIVGGYYDEAVANVSEEGTSSRSEIVGRSYTTARSVALVSSTNRSKKSSMQGEISLVPPRQVPELPILVMEMKPGTEDEDLGTSRANYAVGVAPEKVVSLDDDGEYSVDETTDEEAWLAMNRGG